MSKRKTYEPMPRRGLIVGQKVRVDPVRQNERCLHPDWLDFYGSNIGIIVEFLSKPSAPNNGAALVEIRQKFGQVIKVYLDTDELIPHE